MSACSGRLCIRNHQKKNLATSPTARVAATAISTMVLERLELYFKQLGLLLTALQLMQLDTISFYPWHELVLLLALEYPMARLLHLSTVLAEQVRRLAAHFLQTILLFLWSHSSLWYVGLVHVGGNTALGLEVITVRVHMYSNITN